MDFQKALDLFQRKSVLHHVEGFPKPFKFYPVSVAQLYRMQTMFNPLIEAVRVWMLRATDVEHIEQQEQQLDDLGNPVHVTVVKRAGSIDPALAQQRSEETKKALSSVVEELFSEENKAVLGGLLADSLRDLFPRPVEDEDVIKFFNEMDVDAMVSFARGFVKANTKVLGPFVKRIQDKWEGLVDQAVSATSEQLSEEIPQAQERSGSEKDKPEDLSLDQTM